MSTHPAAALIAVDWGTTSARAYRLDARGAVLAERTAALGIQRIADGRFAAALDTLLGDWRDECLPRIACGMIGSRQGWVEAPYLACPLELSALGKDLARTPGNELAIVAGARCRDRWGVPDVMRGEETQLAGAFAGSTLRALAVLPGTHSKWALLDGERITEFATFMTGELYSVLRDHSILGRMIASGATAAGVPGAAFAAGVTRGVAGGGLSHAIFGARTLALGGELAQRDVADWLSGVLIGDEIAAARAWARERGIEARRVTIIGEDQLAARYVAALERCAVAAERAPPAAAARGLFRIACHAGLITEATP